MELSSFAVLVGADIVALGRLGDDTTADAATRIVGALGGPINARLLEVLSQVAAELDTQGHPGHAELRVVGNDARLVLVTDAGDEEPPATSAASGDSDTDARITLRLPAALKTAVEAAAAAEGISVNSYIVRRLSSQPSQSVRSQQYGRRRISGYGRS